MRIPDEERIQILKDFMEEEKVQSKEEVEEQSSVVVLEEQPRSSFVGTPSPQNTLTFVTQGKNNKPARKGIVVKVPKKLNWNPAKKTENSIDTTTGSLAR